MRDICANTVQSGPFENLAYPATLSGGGSTLAPKLLGTYELEIQPWIKEILDAQPELLINIGAGEGYYAVGFARGLGSARVIAYEAEAASRAAVTQLAQANGVALRTELRAACSIEELRAVLLPNSVLVCDCEGCELALLEPAELPALATCTILVETHVLRGLDSAVALRSRFAHTHTIREVTYQPGRRDQIPGPPLPAGLRRLAMDERRRFGLRWLFLAPVGSG